MTLAAAAAGKGVEITRQEDGPEPRLRIEINGELFAEYHYQGGSRPYLHPILAPGGQAVTRDWPMKDSPNEEHDHPHHRSFWFAHGDINGADFWIEGPKAGRTVHEAFTEIQSGPDMGVIRSTDRLITTNGTVLATDDRTLRIYNVPGMRCWDLDVTIHAPTNTDLTFGDTKEGTLGLRLTETLRLKPNTFNTGKPTGHIVDSEGRRDDATWGKRARWVDYRGPVPAGTLGVAIFDHPANPRHPTWWHVRDYGLFAANPFGLHEFEKAPVGAGKLVVKAGDRLTFRYRIFVHPGDEKEDRIEEQYARFAKDLRPLGQPGS